MIKKVKETIEYYQMIDNNSPIVVGVSGGPDSMVLLDVLSKIVPNKLIAVHLNHNFRGKEAEEDADFVKQECEKNGISSEIKDYDVPSFMKDTGMGAQEAARKIRYQFYLEAARKWNAKIIALGHHANDQAETILMRILRGTGPRGLSGIPYTRMTEEYKIIRPLLDVSRNEIEEYSKKNFISFRTDQSNYSTKYFRNEIRLKVLPYLKKYNPKLIPNLHQLGKVVQQESSYLDKLAQKIFEESIIESSKDTYKLSVSNLQNADIALQRRVIHLILRYQNLKQELTFIHIDGIIRLINHYHPSKSLDLPGIRVFRNYEQLVFTSLTNNEIEPYEYRLDIPGSIELFNAGKKITALIKDHYEKLNGTWAVFDFDEIKNSHLIIRSRRNGDKIDILGMKGSKKVKDLFIDEKVHKDYRDLFPIIENSGKIIWIPGIKRSNLALISNKTKYFLYIVCHEL